MTDTDFNVVSCVCSLSWAKMDRHWTRKSRPRLFWCIKVYDWVLRHDDSVHREEDGVVRFDDLAELFKSRFAATSHWSIEAWISFLAKERGQSTAWTLILLNISCFSEQSRDIQEVLSLILHCKTVYCHRTTSPITSTTSGTLTMALHHPGWIDSGRKKSQKGQAVRVFHSSEPDVHQSRSGKSSIQSGKVQDRGVQKQLESSPK